MNRKNLVLITLTLTMSAFLLHGQSMEKQTNETVSILISSSDTLTVSYTYWWPNAGPFIGLCGDEYGLVFLGVVSEINAPVKDTSALYTLQNGVIEITEILKEKKLENEEFNDQTYFSSDCFRNANLRKGDAVMVFCYEYEGSYCIPGQKSILKINGTDDPIVLSIEKYISSGQNPLKIKEDMRLWKKKGFWNDLNRIIECRETLENKE